MQLTNERLGLSRQPQRCAFKPAMLLVAADLGFCGRIPARTPQITVLAVIGTLFTAEETFDAFVNNMYPVHGLI